jgi:hypothetical protein
MVIYNTPTRLGCGLCGADEPDVAPVLPPIENEIAVASDPTTTIVAPTTTFDTQVATALKPLPSWAIGLGIGVVALGVIAGVYAVSRRV